MSLKALIKDRTLLLGTAAAIVLGGAGVTVTSGFRAQAEPTAVVAPAAVPVSVETVNPRNVRLWSEFSGRLQAVDFAQIRPEVSGRITEVRFQDGQAVNAGDVLFVIDARPYEAAAARAEANLAGAHTSADLAKMELDRAVNLLKTQDVAQNIHDQRANAYRVAQANVQAALAEVKQARVDLDHAYVKAPIGGRVSRAEITVGNLVQAGANAPLLTSIVSKDGIYADFEVDERTYLKSIRSVADTAAKERTIPVELTVPGDEAHPARGTIHSFDNRIDTASGTIRARAKFDNADGSLTPGMFVQVKLASANDAQVLLVPERAIGNDQSKKFVFVVGADNKVAYREVALGQQVDGRRVVLSGLEAGERVITDGLQHVRPNVTVQATEAGAAPVQKVALN
ncbi:MAG: efflux RND transporter periplasmic adaptor subunit [Rhodospirillaceae bacterium]